MKRIYRFICLGLLVLSLCWARSLFAEEGIGRDRGWELYQNEEYARAAEVWQAELAATAEDKPQARALLYVRLSAAYQRLGRWKEAETAISSSFDLLNAFEARSPSDWRIRAQASNARGGLQWVRGEFTAALETWGAAQQAYIWAGDIEGQIGTQLNRAKALQASGASVEASALLKELEGQLQGQPPTAVRVRAYLASGITQRRLGKLGEAERALKAGLEMARTLRMDALQDEIELELGNVERARAHQQAAIGKRDKAEWLLGKAVESYQRVARDSQSQVMKLQAHLNQLSLAADTGQEPDLNLLPEIEALFSQLPLNRKTIEARLNYARSLSCWQEKLDGEVSPCPRSEWRNSAQSSSALASFPIKTAATYQLLADTLAAAKDLKDPRLIESAILQLGSLYEQNRQWSEAEWLMQQVLKSAAERGKDEPIYRAQWQQGRLLAKLHRPEEAIQAYAGAIDSLEKTRASLIGIDTDVQFSFRDNVEPVYREYIELLLATEGNLQPSSQKLERAVDAIDKLQLAEIENFLRCDLLPALKKIELDKVIDNQTAIIYPIATHQGVTSIFKIGDKPLDYRFAPVELSKLQITLGELKKWLSESGGGRKDKIDVEAFKLYNWIFKALENVLKDAPEINTLVFVLDDPFRMIPMSVLYDGELYLMQKKYALGVAPSLKIFPPQIPAPSLNFISGGVSERQRIENFSFGAIEELEKEIKLVPQPNYEIYDRQFTKENLQLQLKNQNFTAVHWKTHGVFSSNPNETFLVAYRELIRALELNQLIDSSSKTKAQPLELLVLSACSAAKGDRRSVLGLAGVAARAGARTTLSTLWRADDFFNTRLMGRFYEHLKQPGMTKSKALHLAQQELFEVGTKDPHFWANYILIGNWL